MGRHGLQYCLFCNPFGNGTSGDPGTEAIGKVYVEDEPGVEQHTTGWHGFCAECAEYFIPRAFSEWEPLPGHEDHPLFTENDDGEVRSIAHDCENPTWQKQSLVTEDGGHDIVRCEDCGIYAKRWLERIELIGHTL